MSIKLVIFDLDGVIVSTDELHYKSWKYVADLENISFNKEINHNLRGVSRKESLEIILRKASRSYSDVEKENLMKKKNDYYLELLNDLSENDLLPKVKETLIKLKEMNVLVAIGSSSKNAKKILKQIKLIDSFDCISDGTNITNSKPDPEVFLYAAEKLNIKPNECLVVEDAESGIIAGNRAQMKTAGIGSASSFVGCTYKINVVDEIIKYI